MIFALIKYEAHYNQRINKKIFFKRKNNNDAIKFTIKALFRKYLIFNYLVDWVDIDFFCWDFYDKEEYLNGVLIIKVKSISLMNIIILWKVQLKKINIIFYLIKDHNILIMKEMLTIKLYKNFAFKFIYLKH